MKLHIYIAPAVIVFLFGIFPAEWLNIYTRYPYADKIMHIAGSMAIAWLASALLRKDTRRLSPLFFVLFIVGVTTLVGVVWEIAEYGATVVRYTFPLIYQYFHGGDQADTVVDLISDITGGVLLAVLLVSLKYRSRSGQGR